MLASLSPGHFVGLSLVGTGLGLRGPRWAREKELCGLYSLGGGRVLVRLGKANRLARLSREGIGIACACPTT